MMLTRLASAVGAMLASCFFAISANAASYPTPGSYTIEGLFNDGGSLSGSFTIDTYGYLVDPTSITTTPGTILPDTQVYQLPSLPSPNGFQPITTADSIEFTYNYSPTLQITFLLPLGSVTSDPFDLTPANSFECNTGLGTWCAGPGRDFLSGVATFDAATPIPAALPLFASGFGIIGLFVARSGRKFRRRSIR